MKAVVEMKTKDFDGFVANMRAMADGEYDEQVVAERMAGGSPSGGRRDESRAPRS
jgi:hypothetical protein